jgi:hypothetical protein
MTIIFYQIHSHYKPCNINLTNKIHKEKNNLKEINTKKISWEKKPRKNTKQNIHDKENKNAKEYANVCFWQSSFKSPTWQELHIGMYRYAILPLVNWRKL